MAELSMCQYVIWRLAWSKPTEDVKSINISWKASSSVATMLDQRRSSVVSHYHPSPHWVGMPGRLRSTRVWLR
jgi:hypothetical protein